MDAYNMPVLHSTQQLNFQVTARILVQVHLLQSKLPLGAFLLHLFDFTKLPLAESLNDNVVLFNLS